MVPGSFILTHQSDTKKVEQFLGFCMASTAALTTEQEVLAIFTPVIELAKQPEFRVTALTNSKELQAIENKVTELTNQRKHSVVQVSFQSSCDQCKAAIHRKFCLGMSEERLLLNVPDGVKKCILAARTFYKEVPLTSPFGDCNFNEVVAFDPALAREMRDQSRPYFYRLKHDGTSFASAPDTSLPPSDGDDDPSKPN